MLFGVGLRSLLALSACVAACGGALPPEPSAAALHRDLERVVGLADTEGWAIDRVEIEEALPTALMSVCRTDEQARQGLLEWLDGRIAAEGGPVELAYETRGRDLDAVDELLTLTRIRMLLQSSIDGQDECPFWLRPQRRFVGRQILDDRWFLSLASGGKGMLVRQGGVNDLNFGGAGRLLVGRAFGRHATWLAGLEAGARASFPKDEDGERSNLALGVDVVVPIVYRHRLVNTFWEVEAGYVGNTPEKKLELAHGIHVGVAFGGIASRRRWLFPGAAFAITYERIAEEETLHAIKLGFRVSIDVAR